LLTPDVLVHTAATRRDAEVGTGLLFAHISHHHFFSEIHLTVARLAKAKELSQKNSSTLLSANLYSQGI